jgi:hypothetical protein
MFKNNQSAIAYSHNALVSEKTKRIDVKGHFLKEYVEQGTTRLRYLPNDQMVTDMLTKPLQGHALSRHISEIMGGANPMQRFIP